MVKSKTLRSIFVRYIWFMFGFSFLIVAINYGVFIYAVNTDAIHLANYAESFIEKNSALLRNSPAVTTEMIPDVSYFGVYALNGNYRYGSFPIDVPDPLKKIEEIWKNYENGDSTLNGSEFIYVIPRGNEVLLITYPLSLQFSDPGLRQLFPNIEMIWMISIMLEIIGLVLIQSLRFGKYLGNKISILQEVSENIENQNLDFDLGGSDIREIDVVLDGLYHMRDVLKESLLIQWKTQMDKQDQISALAHDLKTPLTIVKGNAELLGETVLNYEQLLYQKYILENAVQMESYINKLVEISKSEQPEGLNFKKVAVKSLAAAVHEQAKGLIAQKKIKMVWQESDLSNEYLRAIPEDLQRAVMNMIGNAVEFTPYQGSISISVLQKQNTIVLSVFDGGKGFSGQAILHGKEQFFMADTSRTNHKHHGMGLYIADNIIKQHGGQFELKNTKQGGLVIITLPLYRKTD
ncbi:MAG: sensor histidine kinase [Acetobacterium sp.]